MGKHTLFIFGTFVVILMVLYVLLNPKIPRDLSEKTEKFSLLSRERKIKRIMANILFFISGLPLMVYPFVLLADITALTALRSGTGNSILSSCIYLFLFASCTYPITYVACFWLYFKKVNEKVLFSLLPLIHILVAVFFGYLWGVLEQFR